jgi:hypothetical protein
MANFSSALSRMGMRGHYLGEECAALNVNALIWRIYFSSYRHPSAFVLVSSTFASCWRQEHSRHKVGRRISAAWLPEFFDYLSAAISEDRNAVRFQQLVTARHPFRKTKPQQVMLRRSVGQKYAYRVFLWTTRVHFAYPDVNEWTDQGR